MNTMKFDERTGPALRSFLASATLFALSAAWGSTAFALMKSEARQKAFATPEQAAAALVEAAESFDVPLLLEILGADGRDLVASEDPVEDKSRAAAFAAAARVRQSVQVDPGRPTRATLVVGQDDWPFPMPIIKVGGKWFFDTKQGRTEILRRRIGSNELDAIAICRGFVEAQKEYALQRRSESGVNEYAQRLISTPGKRDGLAWRNEDGTWGGPVGEGVARAIEQGYSDRAMPFHGYYFKILKGQGPAAPLGELDFVVNGVMIGGFALAAAPAQYRVTGVQTFIVSHQGIVYQKDLGPDSLAVFRNMDRYNPDKSWRATEDEW